MGGLLSWHPEALPLSALRLLKNLGPIRSLRAFYLAGGTGLALQRGHRISVDLDFFSAANPLGDAERTELIESLSPLSGFRVREEKEGTLHAVAEGVELSFLRYRYPLVRKPLSWKGISVAALADIALMKLGAVVGRGARKDFRDLREIVRTHSLESLLKLAPKKFRDHEDFPFQCAKALVYFKDAEGEPEPKLLKPAPWADIKRYFEREVPRVFKRMTLS